MAKLTLPRMVARATLVSANLVCSDLRAARGAKRHPGRRQHPLRGRDGDRHAEAGRLKRMGLPTMPTLLPPLPVGALPQPRYPYQGGRVRWFIPPPLPPPPHQLRTSLQCREESGRERATAGCRSFREDAYPPFGCTGWPIAAVFLVNRRGPLWARGGLCKMQPKIGWGVGGRAGGPWSERSAGWGRTRDDVGRWFRGGQAFEMSWISPWTLSFGDLLSALGFLGLWRLRRPNSATFLFFSLACEVSADWEVGGVGVMHGNTSERGGAGGGAVRTKRGMMDGLKENGDWVRRFGLLFSRRGCHVCSWSV